MNLMMNQQILELFEHWNSLSIQEQPKKRLLEEVAKKNESTMEHMDHFISINQDWFISYFNLYHVVMEEV